jgi:hypothetical protein
MDETVTKTAKTSKATKVVIGIVAVTVVALGVVFGYAMYIGGFSK